jgi:ketosteroid isomerase-like protein
LSGLSANKEVITRMHQALDRGDLDTAVACWAEDAVNHASGRANLPPLMLGTQRFDAPSKRSARRFLIEGGTSTRWSRKAIWSRAG